MSLVPRSTRVALGVLLGMEAFDVCRRGAFGAQLGPAARIPFPGLAWVPYAPVPAWMALFVVWIVLAAAVTANVHPRAAASALVGLLTYTLVVDQGIHSNQGMALWVATCGLALDAPDVLRVFVTTLYAYTALAKLTPDYLSGAVLAHVIGVHSLIPVPAALRTPILIQLASWGVLASEAFMAVAFWRPRLRRLAFAIGVALHGTSLLIMPASFAFVFTIIAGAVVACYPAFFIGLEGRRVCPRSGGGAISPDSITQHLA